MQTKLLKGDEVIIIDVHPKDCHYSKKDLLMSKKRFIFAPPSKEWTRNKQMKEWLSLALKVDDEMLWFWGIKVEKDIDNINET